MILKKPYAFLIKYFRLIHLVLAVPIIYLIVKSSNIVAFFSDYVANNYSLTVNGDLSNIFISNIMYFGIIMIVLATLAVYLLFKYKEKPRKHYIAIIVYYLIFFVLLNVTHKILNIMETEVIEASLARSYRDISLLVILPQIYFAGFVILRGLGFNVKKLNFASDLKELEITEKDSEEFEFVVGVEGYKAKRTIRRFLREFSYYIKENTFIFIALVSLLVIGIGTSIYFNRDDYEKNYKIGEVFNYNYFSVKVEDSIITDLAYNGTVINKNKYYLILKLYIKNNFTNAAKLEHTNFRLKIGTEYLLPIIDKASYFADYATPYNGAAIEAGKDGSYVLVYELNKEELPDNYELKVYNGISENKGQINTKYSNVPLNPILVADLSKVKTVNLKEALDLTNSNIGNTVLTINDFNITDKYIYEYEKCYNNACKNYTDYITVDYFSTGKGSTLLVLDYSLQLDMKSAYSNYIKSEKTFFNNFASVSYQIDNNKKKSTIINKTPSNLPNKLVLQVSDEIKSASTIEINITVRNKVYTIILSK